jgi:hypothetical protein
MYTHATCPECRETMKIEDVTPLSQVPRLGERLDEGSEVPAGQCKHCESLVYVDKEFDPPILSAKFARVLIAIKDIYADDDFLTDVATEAMIGEQEVNEILETAEKLWDKVRWIYEQDGVKEVKTDG